MTISTQNYRPGGNFSALAVTAAGAVTQANSVPRTLYRIIPTSVGSAGSLIISDLYLYTYSATQAYAVGQAVLYSGTIYYCILASTGNLPSNATYFNTTIPTATIAYSAAYNAGSMVVGAPITLELPINNGILVSQVPSAGSPSYTITYS